MKLKTRNLIVLVLLTVFAVSTLLCCCLTGTVQAAEPMPSCHSSEQHKSSSHDDKDCDCDQPLNVIKKGATFDLSFAHIVTLDNEPKSDYFRPVLINTVAFQALSQTSNTLPLYIKHSVLRI